MGVISETSKPDKITSEEADNILKSLQKYCDNNACDHGQAHALLVGAAIALKERAPAYWVIAAMCGRVDELLNLKQKEFIHEND